MALFAALLSLSHCDKSPENPVEAPYAETELDLNGGSWKTYLVANGGELPVAAPEAPGSSAYLAELADLKAQMAAASPEQRDKARFWGGNAVLRWQAIARELAAEYNAAPKHDADGKYLLPDPNNPTAYPRFPFANPPYTARMLALLSVAQYDGLVSAWFQKNQHQRLAPYQYDGGIVPLIPANELPSYPSEDAVLAIASAEVLKFLFPGEKAFLDAQAAEHMESRLWAGANVQSDLDAGADLGKRIAEKVIAYAKTDGMGQANNQANYPLLKADAENRGITRQWTSRDQPARPPMLPFFGRLKPWNFDEAAKVALRPPAPPAPGSPAFEAALEELRGIAKNRSREQFRIASFWADGTGSYTPPGHWNRKAAELCFGQQLNEIRSARVMALVSTALLDAGVSCWDTKYYYLLPRPTEVDASISTSTGIPNFPAYTSGHSTFSAAAAEVLGHLFPAEKSALQAWAKEASESRIYGCIHYRFDCEVGLEVGKKVADYAIHRAKGDGAE
jgi:membrane-associated phospholipid phosphatase